MNRRAAILLLAACSATAACSNQEPHITAKARSVQQVESGERIALSARGGVDGGRVFRFYWTQIEGPEANMRRVNRSLVRFIAPDVTTPTALVFRLTASDSRGHRTTDTLTVTVVPKK